MMFPSWGLMNDEDLALEHQLCLLCYRLEEAYKLC